MTDQEKIDHLKTAVPTVKLTRWQKTVEVIGWTCSALAVVALILSVVASVRASDAARQASSVSACINADLASRNGLSTADARAHVTWATSLARVLAAPKDQVQADYLRFVRDTTVYVQTLAADQHARDLSPLGLC